MHFHPHHEPFFRNAYYPGCAFPVMHIRWSVFSAVILSVLVIFGGCTSTKPQSAVQPVPGTLQQTPSGQQPAQSAVSSAKLTLAVDSLSQGAALPDVYTCKGAGESPRVSWSGIPREAKSLVLIVDDPDAPAGTFTHWLVYNIPPEQGELAQGQPFLKVLSNDAQQGESSTGSRGYYPPCPPLGSTHRYIFRLYAVDMDITQPTADRASIDWALTGHTIAKTEFTTTFGR
jgi:Raf kinase inhibitor-like YbhB/YbcL family protein